jgi:hypothetical protein
VFAESKDEGIIPEPRETAKRPELAMFGGQLLVDSAQPAEAASSGSKLGLFLGIAALLLLIAGGVWYSRQPGNAISAMLGGSSTASQPAASEAAEPAPLTAKPVSHAEGSVAAASSSPTSASVNPPAPVVSAAAKNAPAAPVSRNTSSVVAPGSASSSSPSPRNILPVEEPKKAALGDVRLAAPVINHRKASSVPGESEPSIDVSAGENNAAVPANLSASRPNAPAAPVASVLPAALLSCGRCV